MTNEQVIEVGRALLPYLRADISHADLGRAAHDAVAALNRTAPAPAIEDGVGWPDPVVTNPDIADETGHPYFDSLIHRLLDAQQDINLEANSRMSQSLCDASALIDEVETVLRRAANLLQSTTPPAVSPGRVGEDYVAVPRELLSGLLTDDEMLRDRQRPEYQERIDALHAYLTATPPSPVYDRVKK